MIYASTFGLSFIEGVLIWAS